MGTACPWGMVGASSTARSASGSFDLKTLGYGREEGTSWLPVGEELGLPGLRSSSRGSGGARSPAPSVQPRARSRILGGAMLAAYFILATFEGWFLSPGNWESAAFWTTLGIVFASPWPMAPPLRPPMASPAPGGGRVTPGVPSPSGPLRSPSSVCRWARTPRTRWILTLHEVGEPSLGDPSGELRSPSGGRRRNCSSDAPRRPSPCRRRRPASCRASPSTTATSASPADAVPTLARLDSSRHRLPSDGPPRRGGRPPSSGSGPLRGHAAHGLADRPAALALRHPSIREPRLGPPGAACTLRGCTSRRPAPLARGAHGRNGTTATVPGLSVRCCRPSDRVYGSRGGFRCRLHDAPRGPSNWGRPVPASADRPPRRLHRRATSWRS